MLQVVHGKWRMTQQQFLETVWLFGETKFKEICERLGKPRVRVPANFRFWV